MCVVTLPRLAVVYTSTQRKGRSASGWLRLASHLVVNMNSVVQIRKNVFSPERQEIVLSILKSAFPIFVMLESVALIGAVDLEIAGRISTAAQAAVGLGEIRRAAFEDRRGQDRARRREGSLQVQVHRRVACGVSS